MTQPRAEADLNDRLAIVTGGADGIGRALALKLTGIGCHVAIADINEAGLAGTTELCAAQRRGQISTHVADVTDERALERFRDEALAHHDSNTAQLVFLNAGIAGGGSMFSDSREAWERTFDICWRGVYLGARVLLPVLAASDFGRLISTSSINGFWASLGPGVPHTGAAPRSSR